MVEEIYRLDLPVPLEELKSRENRVKTNVLYSNYTDTAFKGLLKNYQLLKSSA